MPSSTQPAHPRFAPPQTAAHLRTPGVWLFYVAILAAAAAGTLLLPVAPALPAPAPYVTALVLAVLAAGMQSFGSYQTFDELAMYSSLGAPILFASFLLLDFRLFVAAVAVSEVFAWVIDAVRRTDVTVWYIRVFNVVEMVVAGSAASVALHLVGADPNTGVAWSSPLPFIAFALAATAWTVAASFAEMAVVALNSSAPSALRVNPRQLAGELAILAVGAPFAFCWQHNAWLAILAIVPLVFAHGLLDLPELEHRARTDGRTGLANAGSFEETLDEAILEARRTRKPVALLVVDVDRFKHVNDTYGHMFGNAVIVHVARTLERLAREGDVVARIGGDEFGVLLRDCSLRDAAALAERLREGLAEEPFAPVDGAAPLALTASLGLAVFPDAGNTARDLFHAADLALYAAKRDGRNQVRVDGSTSAESARGC